MFRLRTGYLISGIITGCILVFSFFGSLPDGKLHIIFCDVGQGDAAYIKFPDGRDMVVDGGPNDNVLGCLGNSMPFWDRHIDMVLLTHPQKDHMQGLISILERYDVDYFVRSDIENTTEGYEKLLALAAAKNIPVKYMTAGESITVDNTVLRFLGPPADMVSRELNEHSLVFVLDYGTFDALFTGDATFSESVEPVEVLKVPHHGSKTGMNEAFLNRLKPTLAVISVGKNNYGHPAQEALNLLQTVGARVLRTDEEGDIEVASDGRGWTVVPY